MTSASRPRVWLITGTSSGLGLALTRTVLQHGEAVVATLRNPASDALKGLVAEYPPDRLLVVKLDVTNRQDILDAFERTKETFGRLDVVVNNAAWGIIAEVEGTPDELARDMFETNFWGGAHVLQEAVRFFREVNEPGRGGRIIHVSSGTGIVGYPSTGFYSASKHAMEGLTETLAMEVDPDWNIKITIIPLGAHSTNAAAAMPRPPPHPAYSKPELASNVARNALVASIGGGTTGSKYDVKGDIAKAAAAIYRLSEVQSPPLRLVLGKDAVEMARGKISSFSKEVEEYASWSEGLERTVMIGTA
ncbi:NAD(P)-binding protein [Daedaleopsis nitida]|nr:NAD(P)-binding protein [Daedaleopsis nitida]